MEKHGKAVSKAFVLDTSVTMTWFFPQEASPDTDALLQSVGSDGTAYVPEHWILEVANVLVLSERKKTTQAKTASFLDLLGTLRIDRDFETAKRATQDILSLARTHALTTYDAAYLELALRKGLPLATLDSQLKTAAKKLGISVLPNI